MSADRPRTFTTLPDKYTPDFVAKLDGRTVIARAVRDRIETIETDMGGSDSLSHARRSLVRRVVWLEAIIEHAEQRLAAGEPIDLGGHTQAVNTLIGLYRLLGLDRKPKAARSLRSVMDATVTPLRAAQEPAP